MNITQPMNRDEAREQAIDWQAWQAEQSMSYDEIIKWQDHFKSVGEAYDLTEEFTENGVI